MKKAYYNFIVRDYLLSLMNRMLCEYKSNSKGELIVKCYYHDTIALIENFMFNLNTDMYFDLNNNLDDFIYNTPVNTEKIIFYNDYFKIVIYH